MKKFLSYLVASTLFCVGTFFYSADTWYDVNDTRCKMIEVFGIFLIAMSACYYYDKIAE